MHAYRAQYPGAPLSGLRPEGTPRGLPGERALSDWGKAGRTRPAPKGCWDLGVAMRRMLYGLLFFGVLALLVVATVVVSVVAHWWAVVPLVLAIGWVSPLTEGLVRRMVEDSHRRTPL